MKKIGIIGAGFIGQAWAKLFMQAGYQVMVSNSRGKNTLFSVASSIGCEIGNQEEAIEFAEIILIAIPFNNYLQLPAESMSNKIILDTMNYYPDRDGHWPQLDKREITTSELVAQHFSKSKVVKVFNAILARDVIKDARPNDKLNRRAIPVAGNDLTAKQTVFKILDQVGYDFVDAGLLSDSWRFERAKPAYCVPLNIRQLQEALEQAQRNIDLPENSWK